MNQANSDLDLFATIYEDVERRKQERQAQDTAGKPADFTLEDLWHFRPGHEAEMSFSLIRNHERERVTERIEGRLLRADIIADAFYDIIAKVTEEETGKMFFTDAAEERRNLANALENAAFFDYRGMNFDRTFDIIEFSLTHENPVFVYETVTWIVDNIVTPIISQPTALEKSKMLLQINNIDAPAFMQMLHDAFMLHRGLETERLGKTENGYDFDFNAAESDTAAAAQNTTAPDPSTTDDKPDSTVVVDAKPVQEGAHQQK